MKSYDFEYDSDDDLIDMDGNNNKNNKNNKNERNKKKYDVWFIILTASFFFALSITDLSYSYVKIEPCQLKSEPAIALSLNTWLRASGIYGIFYYTVLMLIYLFRPYSTHSDHSESNEFQKNVRFAYNVSLIFFSVMGMIWSGIGMYTFIHYFWDACDTYTILVYMWVRVIVALSSYFAMIFAIPCYIFI